MSKCLDFILGEYNEPLPQLRLQAVLLLLLVLLVLEVMVEVMMIVKAVVEPRLLCLT